MKKIYLLLPVLFFSHFLFSQTVITENDTFTAEDTLRFIVPEHRGDVQWQFSDDSLSWIDILDESKDTFLLSPVDTSGYFRAVITEGSCAPVYSSIARIKYSIPVVSTLPADEITLNSATLPGEISDNGGSEVTARGFYWSQTNEFPDENDNVVESGSGTGNFNVTLSELEPNTTYYFRAFAINSAGTAPGNVVSFTTETSVPSVITYDATNIKADSAKLNGEVIKDGGQDVTVRGFYWSKTNESPGIKDSVEEVGSGTGKYSITITNLNANTTYYFRAYATNNQGTAFGDVITFTALSGLPIVKTLSVDNITSNSVDLLGEVTDDGGESVSARGFYWSENENPDENDSIVEVGSGIGEFHTTISDLEPNTSYYVRAFATNSKGTAPGNVVNFTTDASIPSVDTYKATNIKADSAKLNGEVTDNGGEDVFTRGFVWSTNENPGENDSIVEVGSGIGEFYTTISDLEPNTSYYVRAFATNSKGTALGNVDSFTTEASVPSVVTYDATDITAESAELHGEVTKNGGENVSALGFFWSKTNENPDEYDNVEEVGIGTDNFSIALSNLEPNTTYYFKAFATNSIGTATGKTRTFTASSSLPSVTTIDVLNITVNSAELHGEVTDDGGKEIVSRGFYWSENENPNETDNVEEAGSGIGEFSVTIENLKDNTTYYIRAFATNEIGTVLGDTSSFETLVNVVVETGSIDYENKIYKTVKIGDQWWMAENLAYLPDVSPVKEGSITDPHYYVYDYDGSNVEEAKESKYYRAYGVLYNWKAALDACPDGWHLPSDEEWEQLAEYVSVVNGGTLKNDGTWTNVGKHLKAESGWAFNGNGTDDYEFRALPGGYRGLNRNDDPGSTGFHDYYGVGGWWSASATQFDSDNAWGRLLVYLYDDLLRPYREKSSGASVRCVQNETH